MWSHIRDFALAVASWFVAGLPGLCVGILGLAFKMALTGKYVYDFWKTPYKDEGSDFYGRVVRNPTERC